MMTPSEVQEIKIELGRLVKELELMVHPSSFDDLTEIEYDSNLSRYERLYETALEIIQKAEEWVGKAEKDPDTPWPARTGSVANIKLKLGLMKEIMVARDVTAYDPKVVADLWLKEDYYIGGSAVESDLKPEIVAHLYMGGYDLTRMVEANWTSFDNFNHLTPVFREAFNKSKMNASKHMDEKTRAWFEALPDVVTVYRGCERDRVDGLSWTTEIDVARKFASKSRGGSLKDPVIAMTTVKKSEAFYASNKRNEYEIVHDPSNCNIEIISEPSVGSPRL